MISKIYNSDKIYYKSGSRKGKSKKRIERKEQYFLNKIILNYYDFIKINKLPKSKFRNKYLKKYFDKIPLTVKEYNKLKNKW